MTKKNVSNASEAVYNDKNWIKGELQDTIYYKDGRVVELPADHNLVVSGCRQLIAALFMGKWENTAYGVNGVKSGLKYWAIGDGTGTDYENRTVTAPEESNVRLEHEIFRKEITSMCFVDDAGNEITTPNTYSNRLRITVTIDYTEGNMFEDGEQVSGEWQEMALFGGGDASIEPNTGIMVNRKVHEKIGKTDAMKVSRTLTFTF